MIPRWQMVGIFALLLAAVGFGIYASPNSYAYMFLTGRCFGPSVPNACHSRPWRSTWTGFGGKRFTP